jgi:YbgC/YbaW family acyl-CoA thioester hydrolase
MSLPFVDFTVYPDECDAYGHLNQAAFLSLFERARWEMLARTAGMDLFTKAGVWPAVRRTTIEYHAQALPGERLRFEQSVAAVGNSSFTMQQSARHAGTGRLVATAELVFVCVGPSGKPVPVPTPFRQLAASSTQARSMLINDVRLTIETVGEGPALLFVHGYPLGRYLWRHQVDNLAGWRRINPDLRGLGQSAVGAGPGRLEQYGDDLIAVLDALGVEQAVICGLSMGGYVALDLARRYRSRIAGLILIATRAEGENVEGRRGRDAAVGVARRHGSTAIAESMVPKIFAPGAPQRVPELIATVREQIAATPVEGIVQALEAMRDRPDNRSLLPSLAGIPTLVLSGAADLIIPVAEMRSMAGAIPGAVYQAIDEAGHLPPLEQSAATTAAIAGFLSGLSR